MIYQTVLRKKGHVIAKNMGDYVTIIRWISTPYWIIIYHQQAFQVHERELFIVIYHLNYGFNNFLAIILAVEYMSI